MSARPYISPALPARDAFEAGRKLGQTVRQARADRPDLVRDQKRYVDDLYANYATYEFIRQGFIKGYADNAALGAQIDGYGVQHIIDRISGNNTSN